MDLNKIGKTLKEHRLGQNLSIRDLSNMSNVAASTISQNKLPRSKLRGISLDLASLGIFVKRSKLRGIRPVSD